MNRGDIVVALFPNTDGLTATYRPALVVQADNLDTGISQVLLASVTSNMLRDGHLSRVTLLAGTTAHQACGLLVDSVIMTDNLATVPLIGIGRVVGALLPETMALVEDALRHTLGL